MVLCRYMLRNGFAGSYSNSIFVFKGTSILFSIVAAPVYIPTNSVGGFPFLHTLCSKSSLGFCLAVSVMQPEAASRDAPARR